MAVMHPSLDDCNRLAQPLNAGELRVARKLAELDDSWTVYVQPRLAHDVPDFVAVHDRHGVCAIEVKDWSYGAYEQADDGTIRHIDGHGVPTAVADQPRYQAYRYRSTIFDQFFALPEDGDSPPHAVRAVVIMPRYSTAHAEQLLAKVQVTEHELSVRVWGGDRLEQSMEDVVRGPGCPPPRPASVDRLRRQLATSGLTVEVCEPARMSADARNIATNPSGAKRRRVRGPAGCGKSFGLAARAARLAADHRQVLVLSFNTTLANYLRSLVDARCRELAVDPTPVTCVSFHSFCTRLVEDAEVAGITTEAPEGMQWFDAIVDRARQACEAGFRTEYDTVLVDEGQDFTLDWWNLLRHHVVHPDGEMLLVVDPTQDVYEKRSWTDEDQMLGSGFSGPWTELKGSYRLPSDVVPIANRFAERYLGGERLQAEVPADIGAIMGSGLATRRRWRNIDRVRDLGREIGQEVVRLLGDHPELSPNDVVFLCDSHDHGLDAVEVIERAGYAVHHIFAKRANDRSRRKRRFWPDAPGVKGCTVHSFKGWEAPALVMGVGRGDHARRLAYVAMTRIRIGGQDRPAHLRVVNADLGVAGFESTFTDFAVPTIPVWAAPAPGSRVGSPPQHLPRPPATSTLADA